MAKDERAKAADEGQARERPAREARGDVTDPRTPPVDPDPKGRERQPGEADGA